MTRKTVRVQRARRESTCPVCKGPILVGQQIARCNGVWFCLRCFIAHRHPPARTEEKS